MPNNADSSAASAGPKAIASLAKKPSDVTRQGTQKLKFVPTLPARRKKEEVKQETPQTSVQPSDKGNARGRSRGRGRGGEGRGAAPRPPQVEMTASGPFAMGPALAGTSARRTVPGSTFTPVVPQGSAKGPGLGANLSNSAAPTLKKDKQRETTLVSADQTSKIESDEEVYSEPDEGVEIIDMENVRELDWMAPETLRRERRRRNGVKTESEATSLKDQEYSAKNMDPSNALDLSESEQEKELEDLVEDFAIQTSASEESIRQGRLYFFQFPEPFPTFVSASVQTTKSSKETEQPGPSTLKRKVSFAANTKSPASGSGSTEATGQDSPDAPKEVPKVDGMIGQVEVYRSGMVKMRLGNGIVLNVSEATRPSFLQQAVHLDMENKKLYVLGEVNKRFVVSPDLDSLLTSMELADTGPTALDDTDLIRMDTT